jgi:hypothetical protein
VTCGTFAGIDGELCSVNQPDECEKLATKPIKYVMAFDNGNEKSVTTSLFVSNVSRT